MASKKIETQLLMAEGEIERNRALKEILIDFDSRIGRLEKVVIATLVAVLAVGGREYVLTLLAQFVG